MESSTVPTPSDVYDIVSELIARKEKAPPSRNQNFGAYQDPTRSAAYRLYGRLLGIKRELQKVQAAGKRPSVETGCDRLQAVRYEVSYELDVPQGPLRRLAHLSAEEWELLRALCGPALL